MITTAHYLESFGSLRVPRDVWRAMQRFTSWIEPSIVAEWMRIMKGYARNMERELSEAVIPQLRHGPSQIATSPTPAGGRSRLDSSALKGWTL